MLRRKKLTDHNFSAYLRYKKIIDLITKKERTSYELIKETGLKQATVYNMINSLIKNKVILISHYNKDGVSNPTRVFQIVKRAKI